MQTDQNNRKWSVSLCVCLKSQQNMWIEYFSVHVVYNWTFYPSLPSFSSKCDSIQCNKEWWRTHSPSIMETESTYMRWNACHSHLRVRLRLLTHTVSVLPVIDGVLCAGRQNVPDCINREGLYLITHVSVWERDNDIISDQSLWIIRFTSKRCIFYYEVPLTTAFADVLLADVRWNKQGRAELSDCKTVFFQSAKPIKLSVIDCKRGLALRWISSGRIDR